MSSTLLTQARRTVKRTLARNHGAYRRLRRVSMFGKYLCRRPHEADFAAFRHFTDRTGLFLDVGGNSGESVLSFRLFNPTAPILSIEPNPYHEPDLRFLKDRIASFDYMLCAAGEHRGRATLYVPVYRDLPLTGEASFHRDQALASYWMQEQVGGAAAAAVRLLEVEVEVRRLDDLALDPAFVKIDVQGFETQVIAGLHTTIVKSRPVLLLERSGCDEALFGRLGGLGYDPFVYRSDADTFEHYAHQPVQNVFFLPRPHAF